MKRNIFLILITILFYNDCLSQTIDKINESDKREVYTKVIDTIRISQPIRLFVRKNKKLNTFYLSKTKFDRLKSFRQRKLINDPEIYLTSLILFSYLDPKKYSNYPDTNNNSLDKRVIVNKNINYVPIVSEQFIFLLVDKDFFNLKENSIEFNKIKKSKSNKLKVAFDFP